MLSSGHKTLRGYLYVYLDNINGLEWLKVCVMVEWTRYKYEKLIPMIWTH